MIRQWSTKSGNNFFRKHHFTFYTESLVTIPLWHGANWTFIPLLFNQSASTQRTCRLSQGCKRAESVSRCLIWFRSVNVAAPTKLLREMLALWALTSNWHKLFFTQYTDSSWTFIRKTEAKTRGPNLTEVRRSLSRFVFLMAQLGWCMR